MLWNVSTHLTPLHCLKISMNSKFKFHMLVNQFTCSYCPMFGMRMIIILACKKWPVGLTMESGKWTIKTWEFLFMIFKFYYFTQLNIHFGIDFNRVQVTYNHLVFWTETLLKTAALTAEKNISNIPWEMDFNDWQSIEATCDMSDIDCCSVVLNILNILSAIRSDRQVSQSNIQASRSASELFSQ